MIGFSLLTGSFVAYALFSMLPAVHALDSSFLHYVQGFSCPVLKYGLVPFVIVGSVEISVFALLVFSFWLYGKGDLKKAYLVLAVLLIFTGIEFTMKQLIHHSTVPMEYRGRFPFIPVIGSADIDTNYSFPSGHSLRSALLFGLIFLWSSLGRWKGAFLAFVLIYLLVQILGMNYYGFHWTSEVIGGYWLAVVALSLVNRVAQNGLYKNSRENS